MRRPMPAPPRCAGADAVVGDLELHGVGVPADGDLDARRRGVAPRVADRLAEHRLGDRLEDRGISTPCCQSTATPARWRASRSSSSRSVSAVCRGVAASGRAIASRRSSSAAPQLGAAARRWSARRAARPDCSAMTTPKTRWTTRSWISRARSMRSARWRPSTCWRVAMRADSASAQTLPSDHRTSRSWSVSCALGALGEDHAEAVAARGERDADEMLDPQQRVVGRRQLVGAALEHLVEVERAAGDRRRLDREVVAVEELDVDPVGADDPHAAGDVVVDEDDRAPHRAEAADGLGQAVVEGAAARRRGLLDLAEQRDEQVQGRDRRERRARTFGRTAPVMLRRGSMGRAPQSPAHQRRGTRSRLPTSRCRRES